MTQLQTVHKELDLIGKVCPWPVMLTMKELKKLGNNEVLDVLVDHFPSTINVPEAAKKEGHEVIENIRVADGVYKIIIRVRR